MADSSNTASDEAEAIKNQIDETLASNPISDITKFMLFYISGIMGLTGQALAGDAGNVAGSIAGGLVAAGTGAWSDKEQEARDRLFRSWMKLQEDEIKEIGITLIEVMQRIDTTDERVMRRIESPEYLRLIKKCFRDWAAAESEEKRILVRNLLVNAAAPERRCEDDIVILFIKWIDTYSEPHFAIVKQIYNNSGITRGEVWNRIYAREVRENSSEADLFKLYFHDLSTGRIIRQHREFDHLGNPIKQKSVRSRTPSNTMTSAFDDNKEYELTSLGQDFVHYTMTEVVPKISAPETPAA